MQRDYQATDKALKQLLLGTVIDMYTISKNQCVTGYANITMQQFIIHIHVKYGNITKVELKEN